MPSEIALSELELQAVGLMGEYLNRSEIMKQMVVRKSEEGFTIDAIDDTHGYVFQTRYEMGKSHLKLTVSLPSGAVIDDVRIKNGVAAICWARRGS
jgi:hypothetical protein